MISKISKWEFFKKEKRTKLTTNSPRWFFVLFFYPSRINSVTLLLNKLVGYIFNDRIDVTYTLHNSFHSGRKWPSFFSGEL